MAEIIPQSSTNVVGSQIKSGKKYVASNVVTGVAAATNTAYLIRTPLTTTKIYFIFSVISSLGLTIKFFQGPTTTVDGTPVAAINQNRRFLDLASLAVFSGPTITANGTQLYTEEIGNGTSLGGSSKTSNRNEDEWLLQLGTDYLLLLTTSAAASTDITTVFRWLEI